MDTPLNDQDRIVPTGERPVKPDNSAEQLLSPKDERIVSANPSPDAATIAPTKDVTEQLDSVDSGDLRTGHPLNAYASHEQNPSFGYGNSTTTWGRYSQYVNADGLHISPVIYNDNTSLFFHSGYGFNPEIAYGQYSPVATPLPSIMVEGQLYSPQQIPFSPTYFPQAGSPNIPSALPASPSELIASESSGDNLLFAPGSGYYVHYGSFDGGNASVNPVSSPLTSPAGYPQPMGILGSYEQNVGQISRQGPFNGFGLGSSSSPGSYSHGGPYQNSYFGSNDRIRPPHDKGRRRERDQDSICISNDSHGVDRNRGPRASKMKGKSTSEQSSSSGNSKNNSSGSHINPELYNRPDFVTEYKNAKFFIIKSFSEDNVHKSIKYNVWASTPHGNKKLDAAYHEAKGTSAPVFLLFSVNASGQFCGVAEMIGPVDFEKDADYWQQDRWSGQFPVKWHVIKDVPNNRFRHLLLENNDNKPVTHSRDSQEVKLEQGIEMLKIFKDHDARTCILDDFDFYDERERTLRERRARQQASSTKDAPDLLADNTVKLISDTFTQILHLEDGGKETPASDAIVFSTQDVLVSHANDSTNQTSDCFSVSVELEKINKEISAAETGAEHQN